MFLRARVCPKLSFSFYCDVNFVLEDKYASIKADAVAENPKELKCFLKDSLNSCINKKSTDFIELTES